MVILGYRPKELLKKTASETIEDNVLGIAAQVAYNFFFSLFPLLLFLAPLLSLLGDKRQIVTDLMFRLSQVVPADAFALVSKVVTDVVFAENAPGLISIGAVLAAWSGSNIFTTFMDALDTAYDVKDPRPWWKKRLLALGVMVGWALIITAVTAILLAGDSIVEYLRTRAGMGSAAVTVWSVLQVPLAFALLVAFLFLMYWLLPYVKQDSKQILVGSVAAAFLFGIATLVFRLYLHHFPPNKVYGTIGAIMVLLTWMYLVSVVILVGGELNSELHHGTGSVASRKGSVYAGRIATGEQPAQPSSKLE
ncbi:MAG TPA: YihY/virulence factor BrkB family protein [Gemmatimonadaceae bacterium]|jgi:membrane protein|nr:YihY/virulence factor BrkB family protein [Gemmatimonadaceae bacterium]